MDMLLPEHRHRIGMDLQNLTTPTAKNLVAGMFSKREKERPSAGLMIPLCHVHSKPSVLFTITDEDKQHESCSFPYEMHDRDDGGLVVTALRAGYKELGLLPADVEVLGTMSEGVDAAGEVAITPVVAYLGDVQPQLLKPARSSQVCSNIAAPLEELLSPECLTYKDSPHPPFVSPSFKLKAGTTIRHCSRSPVVKCSLLWHRCFAFKRFYHTGVLSYHFIPEISFCNDYNHQISW